jgi:hypothetical protein
MALHHRLDLPFSLVFDTLLLPLDASHGPYNNQRSSHSSAAVCPSSVSRGVQLKFSFIPLMQRILFQPLLTQLYLVIIAVKNALCRFAAQYRQAFAFFIFVGKKFGLPGDIAILQNVFLDIQLSMLALSSSLSGLLSQNSSRAASIASSSVA